MTRTKWVAVLMVLVTIVACTNEGVLRALNAADELMESRADSSLQLLDSIDVDELRGAEHKARYALLYSQALDKNAIDVTNDSLAKIAVEYYAENGSDFDRARAYYYLGRVYQNAFDAENFAINMSLAEKFVPDSANYLKALIYCRIGDLYDTQGSYDKSIEYYKISAENFEKAGQYYNQGLTLNDMVLGYELFGYYDSAMMNSIKVREIFKAVGDTNAILNNSVVIAGIKGYQNVPVREIIDSLMVDFKKYDTIPCEGKNTLAELYSEMPGYYDSVKYYLDRTIVDDSIRSGNNKLLQLNSKAYRHHVICCAELNSGNYKEALEHYCEYDDYSYQISQIENQNNIDEVTSKYKYELYRERAVNYEAESRTLWYMLIMAVLLAIGVVYILVYRYRIKEHNFVEELSARDEMLRSLKLSKAMVEEQKNSNSDVLGVVARITSLIENMPLYEKRPARFITEFKDLFSNDKDKNSVIYDLVNDNYNGALEKASEQYSLTATDLDIICMGVLGFTNNGMRIVLNHTNTKTIYNNRRVVKNKITTEINREDLDIFLRKIH